MKREGGSSRHSANYALSFAKSQVHRLEALRYLNMEHLQEHKKETLRALAA